MSTKYSLTTYSSPQRPAMPSLPALPASIVTPQRPQMPQMPLSLKRPYQTKQVEQSFLSNYNDPYEINSMADTLLNTEGLRRQNYFGLNDTGLFYDIIARPLGQLDLMANKFWKPVLKGKFGTALLNLLMNAGETLDVVANPVKGFLIEGVDGSFSDAVQGFNRGLGAFSEDGRQNYDWDTGNLISDVALEVVSDPLNWVTLFGKAGITAAVKGVAVPIVKDIAAEAAQSGVKIAAKEVADSSYSRLIKKATHHLLETPGATWNDSIDAAAKGMQKTRIRKPISYTDEFISAVKSGTVEALDFKILTAAQKIITTTEAFEHALRTAVVGSSYGLVWWGAKRGFDLIYKHVTNNLGNVLKPFKNPFNTINMSKFDAASVALDTFNKKNITALQDDYPLGGTFTQEILQESFERDLSNVTHIINLHKSKPAKLLAALEIYFSTAHEMNMKMYLRRLKGVSSSYNEAFDDYYTQLANIWVYAKDLGKTFRMEQLVKKSNTGHKRVLELLELLRTTTAKGEAIPGVIKDTIGRVINEAGGAGNTIEATINELQTKIDLEAQNIKSLAKKYKQKETELYIEKNIRIENKPHMAPYIEEDFSKLIRELNFDFREERGFIADRQRDLVSALRKAQKQAEQLADIKVDRTPIQIAASIEIIKNAIDQLPILYNKLQKDRRLIRPRRTANMTTALYESKLAAYNQQLTILRAEIKQRKDVLQAQLHQLNEAYKTSTQKEIVMNTRTTQLQKVKADLKVIQNNLEIYFQDIQTHINDYDAEFVETMSKMKLATTRILSVIDKRIDEILQTGQLSGVALATLYDIYDAQMFELYRVFSEHRFTIPERIQASGRLIHGSAKIDDVLKRGAKTSNARMSQILEDAIQPTTKAKIEELTQKQWRTLQLQIENILFEQTAEDTANNFVTQIPAFTKEYVKNLKDIVLGADYIITPNSYLRSNMKTQNILRALKEYENNPNREAAKKVLELYWAEELADPNRTTWRQGIIKDILDRREADTITIAGPDIYSQNYINDEVKNIAETMSNLDDEWFDELDPEVEYSNLDVLSKWYVDHSGPGIDLGISDYAFVSSLDELLGMNAENPVSAYYVAQEVVKNLRKAIKRSKTSKYASDTFMPIIELLEALPHADIKPAEIALVAGERYYKVKLSQLFNNLAFYSLDINTESTNPMISFMHELLDVNSAEGNILKGLRQHPDFHEQADKIYQYVTNYKNYSEFVQEILQLTSKFCPEDVRLNFIDTLQRYDTKDLLEMDVDFEHKIWNILKTTEEQTNSIKMERNLDLESLYKTHKDLREYVEQVMGTSDPQMHIASTDAIITRGVYTKLLGKDIHADPKTTYIFFDTESTGLYGRVHKLAELSWHVGDEVNPSRFIQCDQLPSDAVLEDVFFPGYHNTDLKTLFRQRYGDTTLPTEKEAILAFIKQITDLQAKEQHVVLVGQNSKKHDMPFIKHRIEQLALKDAEINELINTPEYKQMWYNTELQDTWELMQKQDHYFSLPPEQRTVLSRALENYIQKQKASALSPEQLEQLKFIQPVTGAMANDFLEFGKAIEKIDINASSKFRESGTYIYDLLKIIGRTNKEDYKNTFFKKTFFEKVSALGEYTNVTKYMNEDVEGAREYAVKTAIDTNLIYEYFNVQKDVNMALVPAVYYTAVAHSIERKISMMRNILPIEDDGQVIVDALNFLKTKYKDSKLFENLKIKDVDQITQNWAMLEYAVNTLTAKKIDIRDLDTVLNFEQIGPILFNPEIRKVLYTVKEPLSEAAEVGFGKPIDFDIVHVKPTKYYKNLDKMFTENTQGLRDLSKLLDEDAMYTVSNQRITAALEAPARLLSYLNDNPQGIPYEGLKKYGENLKTQQILQLTTFTPEEMYRHLFHNAKGFIRIGVTNSEDRETVIKAIKQLIGNKLEFSKQGIELVDRKDELYIVLHKAQATVPEKFILSDLDFKTAAQGVLQRAELIKLLDDTRDQLRYYSDGAVNGTFGDYTNKKFYEEIYKMLPMEIYSMIDNNYVLELFNEYNDFFKGTVLFNHTNLGSTGARMVLQKYAASNLVRSYINSSQFVALRTKTELEYLQLYFQKSLSITESPLFKGLPPEKILQILQAAPEYRLVALVADEKTKKGYRIISLKPNNVQSIITAQKLEAAILPSQTYSKMVEVINNSMFDEGVLKWWHRLMYAFKVGYLILNVGTPVRNFVDGLIKNVNTAIAQGIPIDDTTRAYMASVSLYAKYKEAVQKIMELSGKEQMMSDQFVKEYFDDPSIIKIMTREEYDLVHNFLKDGPSAGQIQEILNFEKRLIDKKRALDLDAEAISLPDRIWGKFVDATGFLMKPNTEVEQLHRFAQYLMLLEAGSTTTSAFHTIAQTHFDYALKTDVERYIELVIPFYTFRMKNLEYWVDTFVQQPWAASLYRDVMTPVWNFDDYSYDELSRNRSLQYQVLSGAVPLGDSRLNLKLSPSFMDALQIMTDPIGAVEQGLAPPIKFIPNMIADPTNPQNFLDLIPYFGAVIQRYKSAKSKLDETPAFWEDLFSIIGFLMEEVSLVVSLPIGVGQMCIELARQTFDLLTGQAPVLERDLLLLFSSLLSMTKRWEPYPQRRYNKKQWIKKTYPKKRWTKKTYAKKTYTKKKWAKNIRYRYPKRYKRAYIDKARRVPRFRVNNFYKDLYTTTGKSKFKSRMLPVTSATLKYRVKDKMYFF